MAFDSSRSTKFTDYSTTGFRYPGEIVRVESGQRVLDANGPTRDYSSRARSISVVRHGVDDSCTYNGDCGRLCTVSFRQAGVRGNLCYLRLPRNWVSTGLTVGTRKSAATSNRTTSPANGTLLSLVPHRPCRFAFDAMGSATNACGISI